MELTSDSLSAMVQKTLADACLVIEALGPKSKERFISDFIKDQLQEYDELYNPSPAMGQKKVSSGSASAGGGSQSFKKSTTPNSSPNRNKNTTANKPTSLDTVENRFTWFRNKLRSLQLNFNNVFISEWNVHYRLTVQFLEMTARHLKFTLKKYYNKNTVKILPFKSGAGQGGSSSSSGVAASAVSKFGSSLNKSSHGNNNSSHGNDDGVSEGEKAVTALLKALQKTILFEKEMMAWLSRDFGTKFIDPTQDKGMLNVSNSMGLDSAAAADEDDDLEFDSQGRAYPAQSPEGIKIKYERRKRMGGKESSAPVVSAGGPVASLAGLASTTFDDHMSPYVSLEERSMDEQLYNAASDNEVDTRGERPVFVSSTNLFIYIKNSITRCTALTKEKTFFLLQRAFQKKLRGYASVLEKKLPQPSSTTGLSLALSKGVSGTSSQSSSSTATTTYRIPQGEEVTICHGELCIVHGMNSLFRQLLLISYVHISCSYLVYTSYVHILCSVIDTCEYCADTVEVS